MQFEGFVQAEHPAVQLTQLLPLGYVPVGQKDTHSWPNKKVLGGQVRMQVPRNSKLGGAQLEQKSWRTKQLAQLGSQERQTPPTDVVMLGHAGTQVP